jgi:hypothetical protein
MRNRLSTVPSSAEAPETFSMLARTIWPPGLSLDVARRTPHG